VKVACLQLRPEFGEVERNLDHAAPFVQEAARQGAQIVVLPELYSSGYVMGSREEALRRAEPVPEGPSTQFLRRLAASTASVLVMGLPERDGDRVYNSCVLVTPSGEVTRYRKIHLFYKETEWFDPGEEPPPVVDVGGLKVGLMICWDWIFPEVARTLALAGAEILAHPSNLVLPYCQDAMVTRCLENRVFAITCNRIGREARADLDLTFTGRSQITAPDGKRLARGDPDREQILVAEIRPEEARNKKATEYNDLFRQRRPQLYRLD
jgi:predicted amidohydrolase